MVIEQGFFVYFLENSKEMLYRPKNRKLEKLIQKYDKEKQIVFVSQASSNMCWARLMCKFVLDQGYVPVNYFTVFGHFVHELADLETMIDSVNSLIVRCNQLWAFGEISEGMWYEIKMCKKLGIPVKYFSIERIPHEIKETTEKELSYQDKFEEKIRKFKKFTYLNKLTITD